MIWTAVLTSQSELPITKRESQITCRVHSQGLSKTDWRNPRAVATGCGISKYDWGISTLTTLYLFHGASVLGCNLVKKSLCQVFSCLSRLYLSLWGIFSYQRFCILVSTACSSLKTVCVKCLDTRGNFIISCVFGDSDERRSLPWYLVSGYLRVWTANFI